MAKFEAEGDTEAVEKLMTAGRYQFRYIAQRLLDDRAEKAERAAAAQPYLDKGYIILAEEPQYGTDVLLADLVTDDGSEVVTAAHTETDPARWAVWLSKDERYFDTESGEEVDGEEVDWSTENHPDATPYEGHRHANTVQTRQVWTPEYVCLDLDGAAVALSPVLAAARTATEGEGTEDDAAAALRMEAESKERQRTERRQVRELNKQAEVILSQLHCYCCDQDRFDADVSPTQPSIWSDLLLEILRRRVGQWALAGMASTTHRSSSGADRRSPSASLTCADFRSPRNEVCQDPDMAWFMIDPSNEKEIGAIAHGPVLLARVKGVTVGLRSIMAYSAGLEVAVTVVGSGIHAEAMRR